MNSGPPIPDAGLLRTVTRCVVVAPTYNHGAALGGVLRELSDSGLPVIVVNDGATDHTAEVINHWLSAPDRVAQGRAVTHPSNQGKGAALSTAFIEAGRLGYTHAATIDTDGQHDVADLKRLIQESSRDPGSLIVGARAPAGWGAPWASRVGRAVSNWLVGLECGVAIADSQSGMRVYPIAETLECHVRSGRYGFETEVLVRAAWRGLRIIESPIRCMYEVPGGRTTHFRLVADSLRAVAMHVRLIGGAMVRRAPSVPIMRQLRRPRAADVRGRARV